MKKIIVAVIVIILISAIVSGVRVNGNEKTLRINEEESYFDGFYVKDNKVFIKCEFSITNSNQTERAFHLFAMMDEDVKIGLLKDAKIYAVDDRFNKKTFKVGAKSTLRIDVLFMGDFNGTYQKTDRLLPDITIETINLNG